jgi:hypothetical protein
VLVLALRNRQSTQVTSRGRLAGRVLVGDLVLAHDLSADAAAFGDRAAGLPGPGPEGRAIDTAASGYLRRWPRLTVRPAAMYGAIASASRVVFAGRDRSRSSPSRDTLPHTEYLKARPGRSRS